MAVVIFLAVWVAIAAYAISTLRKPLWLALSPTGRTWSDVVPAGVLAPQQHGSITGVIASGTRMGGGKERLWVVFDEQHLMAVRYGGFGRDEPLMVQKAIAEPVVVTGDGWMKTVVFGGGVITLKTPRTTADPLVNRLNERAWAVRSSDALPPPGWFPDPTRRHQLRYWNGVAWTTSVLDGPHEGTDPL